MMNNETAVGKTVDDIDLKIHVLVFRWDIVIYDELLFIFARMR